MKGKKSILITAFALVLLIGSAGVLYGRLSDAMQADRLHSSETEVVEQEEAQFSEEKHQEERNGVTVPDFTVYDVDGNEVQLSDYFGKPVVLNFWASWCRPCRMEMPDFEEIYGKYGEEINFLMVNLTDGSRETVESAEKFVEEQMFTFPVYYDTKRNAATSYGVSSIPVTYFIDEEGYGVAHGRGMLDAEIIEQGINMIYEK